MLSALIVAKAPRERMTVDLRGLAPALKAHARARHLSVSDAARLAVAAALETSPIETVGQASDIQDVAADRPVKLTIRFRRGVAARLKTRARACGLSHGSYQTKPLNIERLDNGYRVERWHMNSDSPPFHKKVIADKTAKVDRRNIGRMHVPGIFFLESMFAPAGTGAEKGNTAGTRQYRNCQFMTPETRRTTHFFWNYLHNFDLDDPNIALSLCNSLREGFMEDKAIIEAQQKLFDKDSDTKLLAIAADAALAHFRRTFSQKLGEERSASMPAAA